MPPANGRRDAGVPCLPDPDLPDWRLRASDERRADDHLRPDRGRSGLRHARHWRPGDHDADQPRSGVRELTFGHTVNPRASFTARGTLRRSILKATMRAAGRFFFCSNGCVARGLVDPRLQSLLIVRFHYNGRSAS